MMNSNTVSGTGYTVRIKPFVLLTAVTFHEDGRNINIKGENVEQES
jgi:hypothetical protein